MATRGSIESVFAAAGIETLDVSEGVSCFVDEVMRVEKRVLVCGSLGLMDKFQSFREKPLKLPPKMASMMDNASRFFLSLTKYFFLKTGRPFIVNVRYR